MEDEVRMWFDLVSQYKDSVNRNRQFNTTLVVAMVGGTVWLLNTTSWSSLWLNSLDVPLRLMSIGVLQFLILILFSANLSLGRLDKVYNDILMKILSGDLANRDQIREEYDSRTTEILGKVLKSYNLAASTLPRSK
ncbi:MAG: hypothetical protein ABR986_08565 [Methanomassiliicoccales archaeon]|jgi:hypothetical protein